ncbi:putative ribonuclease H-like domain-containing protein [Tanacetum coccineum]
MLSESSMLIANIERTNQWTSDAMKSLPKPLGFLSKKLVSLSGDTLLVEMVVCIIPAEIFLQRYHVYQGRWLASFQDDAKMLLSMFGQRTLRSQGGNDDQDKKEKILKISDRKKQSQKEEGIDYDEVFAPVARIEAIRLFLAFASFMGFIVYQMDVKSAFLYGTIDEEVYVSQPPGFVDPDTLRKKLCDTKRVMIDKTLFIKRDRGYLAGSSMSSMGELTFFLGLQVKQNKAGIFISQDKYVAEILKKFDLVNVKTAITPMETKVALTKDEEAVDVDVHLYRSMIRSLMYLTASRPDIMYEGKPHLGLWYPRESPFDLEAFSDSDYGGSNLDRKSTTGSQANQADNGECYCELVIEGWEKERSGSILKRRNVVLSNFEEEESEAQGRKSQDDPLVSLVQGLVTPSKTTINTSREEQVEDISPTTLEAAKTLSRVASQKPKSIDKGRSGYAEGVNTSNIKVSTVSGQVSTNSIKKSIPFPDKGQREGKMLYDSLTKKLLRRLRNKFYKRKLVSLKLSDWIL